jgi:uncharacterized membrane protein (DUF106 family)
MDAFLDKAWEYLAAGFHLAGDTFFALLLNFHFLGPAMLIALLALCTVLLTKTLNRLIITKRYLELEKQFHYWVGIREQAVQYEDRDKGSRMARNIDKAELNRAYYDYFFEGLLLGIARKIIPIFFVFAFINEYYQPEKMLAMFGQEHVMQTVSTSGDPVLIGGVAWYFICLLGSYLAWSVVSRLYKKYAGKTVVAHVDQSSEVRC